MKTASCFPTLETERLRLREMTAADAGDLFAYYSNREVTRYLDWFGPSSVEHAKRLIASWHEGFQADQLIRWGITQKSCDKVIGTIILTPVRGPFRWKLPVVIGYELAQNVWNQGIMTEALQAVISYIFETMQHHRICAEVFLDNPASARLLQKLGFREEGLLRQHVWHEGYETWHDVNAWGLLKSDYLTAAPATDDTAGPSPSVIPALHAYMDALDRRGYCNGAVLVARRGEVLLSKGYGMANLAHGIPNTPQTRYRIGSLTKGFTALAIMQLQERGLLHVHDAIAAYLPDFPDGERITLHHLLTHTSGLYNYAGTLDFWQGEMRLRSASIADVIALFRDKPLAFAPGEKCAYSNAGYILLTAIIEKVSGMSYAAYIRSEILQPLGMHDSGCDDGRTVIMRQATGWQLSTDTVHGIAKQKISHPGDVGGFTAHIVRYPEEELVVIVASNLIITPVERMTADLARIALGEQIQGPPCLSPLALDPLLLMQCADVYHDEQTGQSPVIVTFEDDRLYIEMAKRYGARYKYGLIPVDKTGAALAFSTEFVDEQVTILLPAAADSAQLRYRDLSGTERILSKR